MKHFYFCPEFVLFYDHDHPFSPLVLEPKRSYVRRKDRQKSSSMASMTKNGPHNESLLCTLRGKINVVVSSKRCSLIWPRVEVDNLSPLVRCHTPATFSINPRIYLLGGDRPTKQIGQNLIPMEEAIRIQGCSFHCEVKSSAEHSFTTTPTPTSS